MFGMVMAKSIYNTNGLLAADALGLLALAGPPGWITAILGGGAMFGALLVTGYKNQKTNLIQVLPISRWARPWIGGLEGYQITPGPFPAPHTYFSRAREGPDRTGDTSLPARSPYNELRPHGETGARSCIRKRGFGSSIKVCLCLPVSGRRRRVLEPASLVPSPPDR